MPLPRPPPSGARGALLRARRPATLRARHPSLLPSTQSQQQRRALHASAPRRGGGGAHTDEPGGWLWGEDPAAPKKGREGWELPMYWMFCGSFAVFTVAYVFKPDTRFVAPPRPSRPWWTVWKELFWPWLIWGV
jgi:hypothetical protein